jgi:hypothetical protein
MFRPIVAITALVAALATHPAQAVQRTFVASFGNDANTATNCGFANPCRGFTAAQTVTDPGGEIVALDAAGYGAITITKSITITANPGFYAGISASGGHGVTIATASVNVTLRGLNINSIGGVDGVHMTTGAKLSIENCVISNFQGGNGVFVSTPAVVRIVDTIIRDGNVGAHFEGGATAVISNSKISGFPNRGVEAWGMPASTVTTVGINDSVLSGNYVAVDCYGQVAGGSARVSIDRAAIMNNSYGAISENSGAGACLISASNSVVTGNVYGFFQSPGTVFESLGNSHVRQNSLNTAGTITVVPPL